MQINYKDPRFQRAALSAMADPISNKYGAANKITAQWAGSQQEWGQQLEELGLKRKIHETEMDLAYDKLNWQKSQFEKGMRNAKQAQRYAIFGGLGTTLYAGWAGREMRKDKEAQAAQRLEILTRLRNRYGDEGDI